MSLTSGIAIYFIIWWIVLFAVLPWGVRTQGEAGEVVPGTAESAPLKPALIKKAVATTIVSAIVFAIVYVLVVYKPISLDDIPL